MLHLLASFLLANMAFGILTALLARRNLERDPHMGRTIAILVLFGFAIFITLGSGRRSPETMLLAGVVFGALVVLSLALTPL